VQRYAVSTATFSWNVSLASTTKPEPASNVTHSSEPGSFTVSAPLTTVIDSFWLMGKSYSPGAMTPTVAGSVLV